MLQILIHLIKYRRTDGKFLYHIWTMASQIKCIGIKLEIQSITLRLFKVSHILKPI